MSIIKHCMVREERAEDRSSVRSINEAAFGRPDEADLVERLRNESVILVSMVAARESELVGHILFSRMWIETTHHSFPAVALAPMAVLPKHQRSGIGGELIRCGLNLLRQRGEEIVIVVGHRDYYPRFGFSHAKARLLDSPFPAEAFMAVELRQSALNGVSGRVKYPEAFML